jgi:hypothetical protein
MFAVSHRRGDEVLLVRGGEDTVQKLRRHAERTHRAFMLDGREVYGLSVFCALDELAAADLLTATLHSDTAERRSG